MALPKHTMSDNDEQVCEDVAQIFGYKPCLWQIRVVRAILEEDDAITIAPTGAGKSLTFWLVLLYIKYGISVLVTPLKLLGAQFADALEDNMISVVNITASNATNELFEV
ncbi:hypothetical protein HWV62_12661 [Athelia sp. TMB]|nr:hypothetical protein HWV62_12661 [Athelia sp. TMB]